MIVLRLRHFANALALFALTMPASAADEQKKTPSAVRRLLDQSINRYGLFADGGRTETSPKIVFRWDNKERGRFEGLTAIWLDENRPVAIASIYPWRRSLKHEFDLLSREPGTIARREAATVWSPAADTTVEFRPISSADAPAESRRRRRIQIKRLASEFGATMTGWKGDDSDREVLRMLPTPIHRYQDAPAAEADLLDGAIFAFVKGTDPECVLLIEAHKYRGDYRWEFAFVRQTSGALEAHYKADTVWRVGKVIGRESDPLSGHLTLSGPLPAELIED